MARIVGAALLIIVLINCFLFSVSDSAARDAFHSAGFTTREIRRCRCSKTRIDKIKCPLPLVPKEHEAIQDLKRCLCSRNDTHKTPRIQDLRNFLCYPQISVPL